MRVELGQPVAHASIDAFETSPLQLPHARSLLAVVTPHPPAMLGTGKALRQREGARFTQKAIEHRVRKRPRGAVRFATPESERLERLPVQKPRW